MTVIWVNYPPLTAIDKLPILKWRVKWITKIHIRVISKACVAFKQVGVIALDPTAVAKGQKGKSYSDIDRTRTCAGEPKRFLISLLNHSDTMPCY